MEQNPYEAPLGTSHRQTESFSFPLIRFATISAGGGVFCFVVWCVLDFALVRYFPSHIHDFDLAILLLPILVAVVGIIVLRDKRLGLRVLLSVLATIIATVFAAVLIVSVGLSFHFSIGGTL